MLSKNTTIPSSLKSRVLNSICLNCGMIWCDGMYSALGFNKVTPWNTVKIIKKKTPEIHYVVFWISLWRFVYFFTVNQNFCKRKVIYTTQAEDLFQSITRFTKFHCVPS